jgi:hypothetical protein
MLPTSFVASWPLKSLCFVRGPPAVQESVPSTVDTVSIPRLFSCAKLPRSRHSRGMDISIQWAAMECAAIESGAPQMPPTDPFKTGRPVRMPRLPPCTHYHEQPCGRQGRLELGAAVWLAMGMSRTGTARCKVSTLGVFAHIPKMESWKRGSSQRGGGVGRVVEMTTHSGCR